MMKAAARRRFFIEDLVECCCPILRAPAVAILVPVYIADVPAFESIPRGHRMTPSGHSLLRHRVPLSQHGADAAGSCPSDFNGIPSPSRRELPRLTCHHTFG